MEPGGKVTLVLDKGALELMTLHESIRRVQEDVRRYTGGRQGLVDEFIADRRREAERE